MNEVEIVVTGADRTRGFDNVRRSVDDLDRHTTSAFSRFSSRIAEGVTKMGDRIAKGLPGIIGRAFNVLPPQAQAAVVAAAVALAVMFSAAFGAALAAGILLALGGGILAAGIKAAADSPGVQAAWKSFGDRAKNAFADFGKPFEGPLIRAADTFASAIERMAPTAKRLGEMFAPLIDRLAPAFAAMAERTLPGIEKAAGQAVPLFEALAEHAPRLGTAISKFFDEIAKGGPGAAEFFGAMLRFIEMILPVIGKVIGTLARLWEDIDSGVTRAVLAFVRFGRRVLNIFGDLINGAAAAFGWMPGLGPKLNAAAAKFNEFAKKANIALNSIEDEIVNVTIRYRETGRAVPIYSDYQSGIGGRAHGGIQGAQSGGMRGNLVMVGEHGRELLDLPPGTQVHSNPDTERMLGGSAGGPVRIELYAAEALSRTLGEAVIEYLRARVRTTGGSVQNLLGVA